MEDVPKIFAWKFLAELKQPEGHSVVLACYVKLADRTAAAKALAAEHFGANFRVDAGEPLTEENLHAELQDTFFCMMRLCAVSTRAPPRHEPTRQAHGRYPDRRG